MGNGVSLDVISANTGTAASMSFLPSSNDPVAPPGGDIAAGMNSLFQDAATGGTPNLPPVPGASASLNDPPPSPIGMMATMQDPNAMIIMLQS